MGGMGGLTHRDTCNTLPAVFGRDVAAGAYRLCVDMGAGDEESQQGEELGIHSGCTWGQ